MSDVVVSVALVPSPQVIVSNDLVRAEVVPVNVMLGDVTVEAEAIGLQTIGIPSVIDLTISGPTGPRGESMAYVSLTAATALGGHRVVRATGLGGVEYASSANSSHFGTVIGITTAAAEQDETAEILTVGHVTEPSWSWQPGELFLGVNGLLTQTAPTSGFLQVIGTAVSPTRALIEPEQPIRLI